ncbi:MAG: RNA 2',3'-cyclic phosphodiesterase [Deltaproteobacteria bacterium]|nr:RNA 2',3'-cyclic phosphodiesterase [Deltaproteobacteria bacterium]
MSLVRCFVAAELPEEVRAELAALAKRLRSRGLDLRWVAPASLHLTLKFLGEIPPETFEAVLRVLDEPVGLPGHVGPLRLALSGVGAFPSPRRARVVWAGLAGDVATLARTALTLEARLEGVGVAREARPFAAHLTLGRSRGPAGVADLEKFLGEDRDFRGPEFEIWSLVLYESVLRPGGPLHTPKKTIPLQ